MQCIEFFVEKSQVTNVVKYIRSTCSWNFVYRLKFCLKTAILKSPFIKGTQTEFVRMKEFCPILAVSWYQYFNNYIFFTLEFGRGYKGDSEENN